MSLLGGLFQLLQNTVASINLSFAGGPVTAGTVLCEHAPDIGGIYRIELHLFDSPPLSVGVRVGTDIIFTPGAAALSGAGAYTIQVAALAAQPIALVALTDIVAVYTDMIITQIG